MTIEIYQYLHNAMAFRRGDDLEQAKAAFHGMSAEQMAERHRMSVGTRQDWLDGYQADRDAWKRANDWLELQKRKQAVEDYDAISKGGS